MNNWCLLLLALTALLQPIASFTERSLFDGRQQCCDRQQGLLFRDTRLTLEASRHKATQDRRLDQRDDIFARRLFDTTRSPLRHRVEQYKDKNEIARLSRTDYRFTTAAADRRNFRHFDKEKLRGASGQRFSRNTAPSRNDIESSLRSLRDKQPTSPDSKTNHRTTSDTRLKFLREHSESSKFRTNTAIKREFQTIKYEVEQEKLLIRNNMRITQERRSMTRISSPLKSSDNNNRQSRSRESVTESRSLVSPTIERSDIRQNYRQNEPNPIKLERRVDYKRTNVLNNRLSNKDMTPDRRLLRTFDDPNSREARINIIRRQAMTVRTYQQESDKSRHIVRSESRNHISELVSLGNEIRNIILLDSRNNRRDVINNEVSRREIVRNEDRNLDYKYAVSEDRHRNMKTRGNKAEAYGVRKDISRPEITARRQPLSHMHNADVVRRDDARREFYQRRIINDDRNHLIKTVNDRRQSVRRVESQLVWKNTADHELARKGTAHSARNDELQGSVRRSAEQRRQMTRDSYIRQLNARNIMDGERNNLVATRRQDTRRVEYGTRRIEIVNRDLTHKAVRGESRSHNQYQLDSTRQLSEDMLKLVVKAKRDENLRDLTKKERPNGTQRTMDERRHIKMRRVDMRESRKDINERDSNRRARSIDRMHLRDTTRTNIMIRSDNIDERSDARKVFNAINRDHKLTESRLLSAEVVRYRNTEKELSKINTEDQIIGSWQIFFYILQGLYICGVIAQAYKENGSAKPKTKNQYWWIPTSLHFIKLD